MAHNNAATIGRNRTLVTQVHTEAQNNRNAINTLRGQGANQVNRLDRRINTLQQETNRRLDTQQANIQNNQAGLNALRGQVQQKADQQQVDRQVRQLGQRIDGLHQQGIAPLRQQVQQDRGTLAAVQNRINTKADQIDLDLAYNGLTTMQAAANNNLNAVIQQNQQLTQQVQVLTQQNNALTQQNHGLTQQVNNLTQQVNGLAQQNQLLTQQSQGLRNQLALQARQLARQEFLTDCTTLTQAQTLRVLHEYFRVLPPPTGGAVAGHLVRDQQGQLVALRTTFRTCPLTELMNTHFAQGSTWSELKALFAEFGIPLTQARLRDTAFAALGIA
ncbi:hypothetical protein [Piscinibacter sp.]|uniref:hypothetical protein n=1 Tax=Piscinibacter sp. TaxID=1903157 RepID=UPI002ED42656